MAHALQNALHGRGLDREREGAACAPAIHHLFPGRAEHHIPAMLQFFKRIHADLNTRLEDHVFVFYGADPAQLIKYRGCVPSHVRTVSIASSKAALFDFLRRIGPEDSLILHSGFYSWLWLSLLARPRLWKKTAWVMWGADIAGKNSLRGRIYRRIKGLVVPRLGAVSALVPGDFDNLQRLIGPCRNYVRAFYAPLYEETLSDAGAGEFPKPPGTVRVILGNSGWEQSEHIPALAWLSQFAGDPVEVLAPLGYPRESAYKSEVIETGNRMLGKKFRPLSDMLDWDRYHRLLQTTDVLVLNNKNQQGLGNIYFMLLTGKKVFLRGDSPTFPMLRELGFKISDARDIPRLTFGEFVRFSETDARANREMFQKHLSTQASIGAWSDLLDRIGAVKAAA